MTKQTKYSHKNSDGTLAEILMRDILVMCVEKGIRLKVWTSSSDRVLGFPH